MGQGMIISLMSKFHNEMMIPCSENKKAQGERRFRAVLSVLF